MIKKTIIFIITLLIPTLTCALSTDSVSLSKCIDGDTARFILNKEEIKVRFIGIDTPESVKEDHEIEEYGIESSNYTCNMLKKAKVIKLEYEKKSIKDKYGRVLAYVFVDDKLLEEKILKKGYARVKYIDESYKYYNRLVKAEKYAKDRKINLFSEKSTEEKEEKMLDIIKNYSKKILSSILKEIFK